MWWLTVEVFTSNNLGKWSHEGNAMGGIKLWEVEMYESHNAYKDSGVTKGIITCSVQADTDELRTKDIII